MQLFRALLSKFCLIYKVIELKLFKCLYELALRPQQKVSSEIISGNKKSNTYDKTPAESARKAKERLLKFLKEEFEKQKQDKSILDGLITSFNQESCHCLNMSFQKIKIKGEFLN